jgi:hypothetical protein
VLAKSDQWFSDGTFRTAAKYFYQLYIIHGRYDGLMVPCALILMNTIEMLQSEETDASLKYFGRLHGDSLKPRRKLDIFKVCVFNNF